MVTKPRSLTLVTLGRTPQRAKAARALVRASPRAKARAASVVIAWTGLAATSSSARRASARSCNALAPSPSRSRKRLAPSRAAFRPASGSIATRARDASVDAAPGCCAPSAGFASAMLGVSVAAEASAAADASLSGADSAASAGTSSASSAKAAMPSSASSQVGAPSEKLAGSAKPAGAATFGLATISPTMNKAACRCAEACSQDGSEVRNSPAMARSSTLKSAKRRAPSGLSAPKSAAISWSQAACATSPARSGPWQDAATTHIAATSARTLPVRRVDSLFTRIPTPILARKMPLKRRQMSPYWRRTDPF